MKKILLFGLLLMGVVVNAQVANTPPDLTYCDDDNDGYGYFDLTTTNSSILLGQNTADFTVTYYETLAEAESGASGAIDTNVLYENIIINTQTIYARVEENVTGSYATTTFSINVVNKPELPSNSIVYTICDSNTDGFAVFDLPSFEQTHLYTEIIAAGGNTADYTTTYYLAILANGNPNTTSIIATPTTYPNTSTPYQVIYANVVHTNTGCTSFREVTLHVDLAPIANYTPIEVCDDDFFASMDGMYTFNLTDYIPNITGGASGVDVTFYTNQTDAENGSGNGLISDPTAFSNTVNPQVIYSRVASQVTGCYSVGFLNLYVNPNPTPLSTPDIIANLGNNGVMEECDGNVDGSGAIEEQTAVFDVTQWQVQIINGELGVSAAYYTSYDDAIAGINQIQSPTTYTNTSNPQTIYMSVINDGTGVTPPTNGTGCYTIVSFDIYVSVPEVTVVADKEVLCVDSNGVPLTNISLPVLTATAGPQPATAYNYRWEFNGNDIPGATNQNLTVAQAGNYTVSVSSMSDTSCINTSITQTITSSALPTAYSVDVTSSPCDSSQTIVALAIGSGIYWYDLDNGQPTVNGTFTDVSVGEHTVTITDDAGCWLEAVQVTVLGCELPQDNLTIETISETCVGLDNGMVQITANETYTYEVSMSLNGNAIAVNPNTFTDTISISDLASGTYYVCVTATEVDVTQCFDIYVEAVEDLVGYSGIIDNVYSLNLSGSTYYEVVVNEVVTEITAATTTEIITFEHELSAELTAIKVTTDKECQGRFEETVLLDVTKLVVYPNPVVDKLHFSSGLELSLVVIYDMTGKVVLKNTDVKEIINLAELMKGVYFIKATIGTSVYTSKFIKK